MRVKGTALECCRQRRQRQEESLVIAMFIILIVIDLYSIISLISFIPLRPGGKMRESAEPKGNRVVLADRGDTFSLYLAAAIGRERLNQPEVEQEFCQLNKLANPNFIAAGRRYTMPKGMEVDQRRLWELRIARGQFYNR